MQKFIEDLGLSSVWKHIAPPKVKFFVWLALEESITTRSVLIRRGVISADQNLCPLCNVDAENPNHLLFFRDSLVGF